jgi:hypothetical protein
VIVTTTDLATRTTQEVFDDHLARAARGDTAGDLAANYAADVVLLSGVGTFHGRDGVRTSRRFLGLDLPDARFSYVTKLVEDQYAFLEWTGESEQTCVDDGADGFLISDGLIRMQTVHYTVRHRMGVRAPLPHVAASPFNGRTRRPKTKFEGSPLHEAAQASRPAVGHGAMYSVGLTAHVVPWDDQGFVRTYEQARLRALREGLTANGPKAAARVEQLLRQAGYRGARVSCERTPEQALAHAATWTVARDGATG